MVFILVFDLKLKYLSFIILSVLILQLNAAYSSTCFSAPCKNNGTCNDAGSLGYFCNCTSDYSGVNCENTSNL